MNRRQRILQEVALAISQNALGAGRTTALNAIKAKYDISEGRLRALCLHHPNAQYWV